MVVAQGMRPRRFSIGLGIGAITLRRNAHGNGVRRRQVQSIPIAASKTSLVLGLIMTGASLVNLLNSRTTNPTTLPLAQYVSVIGSGDEPFDLSTATARVYSGIPHHEPRHIGPGENWLQAALGQIYMPIKTTQDTQRLLAGGIANCSERSQILKTIAESVGYQCRFVGLNGHVVLEVFDDHRWRMADPDYGVVFDCPVGSLALPQHESIVVATLAKRGHQDNAITKYLEILQSTSDNQSLPIGSPLSPRLYKIERACSWLIWILPAAAIFIGLSPVLISRRTSSVRMRERTTQPIATTPKAALAMAHSDTKFG